MSCCRIQFWWERGCAGSWKVNLKCTHKIVRPCTYLHDLTCYQSLWLRHLTQSDGQWLTLVGSQRWWIRPTLVQYFFAFSLATGFWATSHREDFLNVLAALQVQFETGLSHETLLFGENHVAILQAWPHCIFADFFSLKELCLAMWIVVVSQILGGCSGWSHWWTTHLSAWKEAGWTPRLRTLSYQGISQSKTITLRVEKPCGCAQAQPNPKASCPSHTIHRLAKLRTRDLDENSPTSYIQRYGKCDGFLRHRHREGLWVPMLAFHLDPILALLGLIGVQFCRRLAFFPTKVSIRQELAKHLAKMTLFLKALSDPPKVYIKKPLLADTDVPTKISNICTPR